MPASFTVTLTPEEFNTLAGKLKAQGYGPEALESGTLPETSGVILSYVVEPQDSGVAVTFTIQKKPMLATVGLIQSRVKALLGL